MPEGKPELRELQIPEQNNLCGTTQQPVAEVMLPNLFKDQRKLASLPLLTFITSCAVTLPITPCIGHMSPVALNASCVNRLVSTSSTYSTNKCHLEGKNSLTE